MAKVIVNDREYLVEREKNQGKLNGKKFNYDLFKRDSENYHILLNGKSKTIRVIYIDTERQLLKLEIDGKEYIAHLVSTIEETILQMTHSGKLKEEQKYLKSPMPGLIQKVLCKKGQAIKKGDRLIVLNAMKMENVIKATEDGEVSKIEVTEGEQVEKGKVLIQF